MIVENEDELTAVHFHFPTGLSVIENPKPSRGSYETWLGDNKPPIVRARLEQLINSTLGTNCKNFEKEVTTIQRAGIVKRKDENRFDPQGSVIKVVSLVKNGSFLIRITI